MATIRNLIVRISVSENTGKGIRRVTTSLRETNRELDRADKGTGRFSGSLSRLGRTSLSRLTKGLTTIVTASAKAAIGLAAVGAAAASLNTAIQAGAALAPLTGLLALLPGAAVGAATALVSLRVATSGVGDAFKEAFSSKFDPKKFAASLKDLSPAARSVAVELHKLRPELIGIRNTAQQALFNPLRGQLTALAKALGGTVNAGISRVAVQIGLAGRQVAEFARQRASVQFVANAFNATQISLGNLRSAIQPVLAGFRSLASVGLSFLPGLSTSAANLATRFGQWAQQISASGRAAQWIQNALATLRQLGGILSNVGGILKSVFSAASAAGSGFLGVIGQALAKLNAFLKTAQGQAALKGIFAGLAAIGTTLGPVIAAVVTQLGGLAAPVARLITLVGPLLTSAINALGPALAALEPGLAAIFGALGQAVTILAPALMPLARALSQIAAAIAPILPLVATLVAQLVSALAPILGQLVVAAAPLIKAIVQLAGAFAPLITPIATIIVQLVQGLVPVLTPLVGIIGRVATSVGGFLVQALQILVRALTPILPILGQVIAQFLTGMLPVIRALAPALLQVLQALMPLVPALVQLLPPIVQILTASTPLLVILIKIASAILNVVLPPVVKLATVLVDVLGVALRAVAKIATTITSAIVGAFRWLYNTLVGHSIIPDLVNGMIRWFGVLPGRIVGIFGNLVKGAVSRVGGLIKWVAGVPGAIVRALGNTGKLLYNSGRNVVVGLWNGIASLGSWLWKRVWSWVKSVLPGPVKFALGIHSPSKVMARLGTFAGQGLAQGILGTAGMVSRASGVLAQAATPGPLAFAGTPVGVAAAGSSQSSSSGGGPDVNTLARAIAQALSGTTVQMDGKPVGEIVSRYQGRAADQRRRTG